MQRRGRVAMHQSAITAQHEALRFERLLADLSARFVNLAPAEVDGAVVDSLRQIVAMLDVDRCQLLRYAEEGDEVRVTHAWAVAGVPLVPPKSIEHHFPWVVRTVRGGDAVVLPRIDALPPEASTDAESFARVGAKSNLTMPMMMAGRVEGAIAFACLRRRRDWPDSLVERVRVLAGVFANALAHKRAQEALDAAVQFERAVSGILSELLSAESSAQDRILESGLRDVAAALGADRATIWRRDGEKPAFAMTHRWAAEGTAAVPDTVDAHRMPWIIARLVEGTPVNFGALAELPSDSASDRTWQAELRVEAGIAVPLSVAGKVVGALSFGSARGHRAWPDVLVGRAQLLGDVLAVMLARRESQRLEQEAQAQAAHAARVGTMGVFAASLVHELTQPLAASLANAETASELLAAPVPDLGEVRATVADIVADDRRAGELIQQLRRFLRRGEVDRVELDLRDVLEEAVHLAGGAAAEHAATVVLDLSSALPRVVCDRVQLQQVFLNLILNAIDAVAGSPEDARRVSLAARPSEGGVVVEVSDSGTGMDAATLERIFEPFFTTKARGMGLGLAISRTIVATHGGTLSARSAIGLGATFRVELPVRASAEEDSPQPATLSAHDTGTVYVIDDDASMRRALERQLGAAGHRVVSFDSAAAFLDRNPVTVGAACIVSDVRMPGPSGLDLQESLGQAGRVLPMVFISGHGDVATTARAMKAGAVNFIAKPFTREALLTTVGEALARARVLDTEVSERAELRRRYETLTQREREVLALVTAGLLNKVIADRLGAAEATVKIHRGRVMEKMGATSVADLVRMAARLGAG